MTHSFPLFQKVAVMLSQVICTLLFTHWHKTSTERQQGKIQWMITR